MPDLIRHPVAVQTIGNQGVFASLVAGCRIKPGMTIPKKLKAAAIAVEIDALLH
ncbi:hypothetical protein [Lampropedia hyalina]|uniref:hypothetical protein n=1 Tax=Lampropedia hyalina TaxID=198706 RepID=UPI00135666F5|nr:hypothetical protein [Lampropedia hyalina]